MRTRRRALLIALVAAVAATAAYPACAQQVSKVWRVGFIVGSQRPASIAAYANGSAFVQGMRDLGYIEGKNLRIEWRFAGADPVAVAQQAAELVKLNVDVIVCAGTRATTEVQKATRTIPIVAATVGDALTTGVASSLARPGANLTGLTSLSVDLSQKQLELVHAVVPRLARIAVLVNPQNPAHKTSLQRLASAARKGGIAVVPIEARTGAELPQLIAAAARGVGLIVSRDPYFNERVPAIAAAATSHRLVSIGGLPTYAEAGGLLSYGTDATWHFRRAAIYVDKILKGAKPGDLPIERPTKFELVLNLKTAKALGVAIPQPVLLQATRLFE